MFPSVKEDSLERKQASFAVTRRKLLGIGFSGAITSLGMAASPLLAVPSFPHIDFGPAYFVKTFTGVAATHMLRWNFGSTGAASQPICGRWMVANGGPSDM